MAPAEPEPDPLEKARAIYLEAKDLLVQRLSPLPEPLGGVGVAEQLANLAPSREGRRPAGREGRGALDPARVGAAVEPLDHEHEVDVGGDRLGLAASSRPPPSPKRFP